MSAIDELERHIDAQLAPKNGKPWWQSKTIWVNLIVLALAAAEDNLGMLKDLLPMNFYQLVAFGLPVVNTMLRFLTKLGVTL